MIYESPIEVIFGERIRKYLHVDATVESQIDCETPWATFRVDFLIAKPNGRRVAVECDGREFHNHGRDELRDGLILGEELVDSIFRIRGSELWDDRGCLRVLAELTRAEPTLFDDRSRDAAQRVARAEAGDDWPKEDWDYCHRSRIWSTYRTRRFKEPRAHWLELYAWSVGQGPVPFQQLWQRRMEGF